MNEDRTTCEACGSNNACATCGSCETCETRTFGSNQPEDIKPTFHQTTDKNSNNLTPFVEPTKGKRTMRELDKNQNISDNFIADEVQKISQMTTEQKKAYVWDYIEALPDAGEFSVDEAIAILCRYRGLSIGLVEGSINIVSTVKGSPKHPWIHLER